jgi:signal transduction histidine kinase
LEVERAALAFNEMQGRLRRYVEDRSAMVAAVAHDLRTPLTRLRFRVESAPEALQKKMIADIDQMDAMIAATMAFVRDASYPAERRRLELVSLVESVADEMAETGKNVTAEVGPPVVIDGDPVALRRLVNNLLDNAVKFGACARARVYRDHSTVVIEVDDDGPGIRRRPAKSLGRRLARPRSSAFVRTTAFIEIARPSAGLALMRMSWV